MAKREHFEYLERPGRTMSDARLSVLAAELRACARECFPTLPDYQCLTDGREAFEDKVISLARDTDGRVTGFCSAVILPVRGVGEVLHLGLTCVSLQGRGGGFTHKLTSRLLTRYLMRNRPFGRLWISNVACVLSSLGNVAMNFRDVYPAPGAAPPSRSHRLIAESMNLHHREAAYIRSEAEFDGERFVFRGSVKDTVFQKRVDDARFHHRDPGLNAFYQGLLDFQEGDEAVQVGYISLLDAGRYAARRVSMNLARRFAARPRTQGSIA